VLLEDVTFLRVPTLPGGCSKGNRLSILGVPCNCQDARDMRDDAAVGILDSHQSSEEGPASGRSGGSGLTLQSAV
jgi:hypothetical protein